nr:valine N-monooxygenase 1-like [Tanacetum cinerariifolium]
MSSPGAPSAGPLTHPSYSSGPSTPPSYSSGPSTPPNYSPGSSRNAECSNCKHLSGKISVLKATINMHMHPEQHTVNSAALLHEVLDEIEKREIPAAFYVEIFGQNITSSPATCRRGKHPDSLTEKVYENWCHELMQAVVDNPSNSIEWAMAEMINQPRIFDKAVDELDRVVGKDKLGSHVIVSRLGLGRNPEVWDDPLSFKPERHMHGYNQVVLTDNNLHLFSFGTGPRGCAGVLLGTTMTIGLIKRDLLREYDSTSSHRILLIQLRVMKLSKQSQLIYDVHMSKMIPQIVVILEGEMCTSVDVVFDGAFGGTGDEEVVGEGVVVISSSLYMLTNICLGGIMVSLIFLEGFDEEALVEFMVEWCEEDEDDDRNEKDDLFN